MQRFIISTVLALTVAFLLGLPLQNMIAWVVAFFLLAVGFRWLFTQKLPPGAGKSFLVLLLGAPLLIMLLHIANNYLHQTDARTGPLFILVGVLLAAWLGPKLWRGNKRFKL